MKLTEHFALEEFTKSDTALRLKIDNSPNKDQIENLRILCEKVLEPIRKVWGEPLIISSGFRCPKLNRAIGGASTSLHMDGLAVDFTAKDKSKNGDLFRTIMSMMKLNKLEARSLIWEYGSKTNPRWIHVDINGLGHSYRRNKVIYYYS